MKKDKNGENGGKLLLILGGAGIGYARSREITEREKNLEILLQILFF